MHVGARIERTRGTSAVALQERIALKGRRRTRNGPTDPGNGRSAPSPEVQRLPPALTSAIGRRSTIGAPPACARAPPATSAGRASRALPPGPPNGVPGSVRRRPSDGALRSPPDVRRVRGFRCATGYARRAPRASANSKRPKRNPIAPRARQDLDPEPRSSPPPIAATVRPRRGAKARTAPTDAPGVSARARCPPWLLSSPRGALRPEACARPLRAAGQRA